MVVRIRLNLRRPGRSNRLALAIGSILLPLALTAFTISLWAFASELLWSGEFFISDSLFAHWQVWLAVALVLLLLARVLGALGAVENEPKRFSRDRMTA